jgi:D-alanyl-lipoteichoic acid acyltransferase DltB (MBOAT superfamily)
LAEAKPWLGKAYNASGVLLSFAFVSLGWVWFALPTPSLALQTFGKLFGIA